MNKDIRYLGLSAVPSDYDSPDGALALSLNLINEDGDIKPIRQPRCIMSVAENHRIILIHSVPGGQQNFLILVAADNDNFSLAWLKRDPQSASSSQASPISFTDHLSGFISASIVGNTIAVAAADGVHFILWKDGDYRYLGQRPPFVNISFGARRVGFLSDTSSCTYLDVPAFTREHYTATNGAAVVRYPRTDDDKLFWHQVSDQALGLLLKNVSEYVTSKGLFYQPFYVRYAFRLFDGSLYWHSAPILILPVTYAPVIGISCQASSVADNAMTVVTELLGVNYFDLRYRILGDLSLLDSWADIISSIDIFISSPVYTFDQSKQMDAPVALRDIYAHLIDDNGKFFTGHYQDGMFGSDNPFCDHFSETSDANQGFNYKYACDIIPKESFVDSLPQQYLFYKVASIDFNDIRSMDQYESLPLIKKDLTNINTLQRLDDDFQSHASLFPAFTYSYNNRLLLSDLSIAPPVPFPLCASLQAADNTTPPQIISADAVQRVRIFSRVNGLKCMSELSVPVSSDYRNDITVYPLESSFPRFIYHPDASAYRMEILTPPTQPDRKFGSLFVFDLKQHPFLNGAYWFGGLGVNPDNVSQFHTDDDIINALAPDAPLRVSVANKVYTSDVDNPFVFAPQNITSIACGRISALASAAKALSQGQFGQFPLYAFTDNGIWALEISASGTISARQPITRDVCSSPQAVTPVDSAVLFTSQRGIMLLAGSQAQCISDAINNDLTICLDDLPGMSDITHPASLRIAPLPAFLNDARMIYDYPHQRIIIYNSHIDRFPYAYVFSLRSNLWSLMTSRIQYSINSYPEPLAVSADSHLVDFSVPCDDAPAGILISRPLKLDAPDVLKTVDTVIQRGIFSRGHIASVLYGSRDLFNWYLVRSSKDHFLRCFSGTPYKYFRIALISSLAPGESLSSASIQFTPRFTNRPR